MLKQATLRRRAAFFTLAQSQEPEEDFVDPASHRHDEIVAALLRPSTARGWHDPRQLELELTSAAAFEHGVRRT
jgi:hypothetical protein